MIITKNTSEASKVKNEIFPLAVANMYLSESFVKKLLKSAMVKKFLTAKTVVIKKI